jgi:hypothetical protein
MFDEILKRLPRELVEGKKFWSNDEEILSKDEVAINYVADLLDTIGYDAVTGYYDPEEDERNGEVDEYTGYYYVSI